MDTLNHATQGFLITAIPLSFVSTEAGVIGGTIGAFIASAPDLIGEYMARVKGDFYQWYTSAHKGKVNKWMRISPQWFLHTAQDRYLHGEGKRWWVMKERGWYEITSWIFNLLIILKWINLY